jgi:hypothetical protein
MAHLASGSEQVSLAMGYYVNGLHALSDLCVQDICP